MCHVPCACNFWERLPQSCSRSISCHFRLNPYELNLGITTPHWPRFSGSGQSKQRVQLKRLKAEGEVQLHLEPLGNRTLLLGSCARSFKSVGLLERPEDFHFANETSWNRCFFFWNVHVSLCLASPVLYSKVVVYMLNHSIKVNVTWLGEDAYIVPGISVHDSMFLFPQLLRWSASKWTSWLHFNQSWVRVQSFGDQNVIIACLLKQKQKRHPMWSADSHHSQHLRYLLLLQAPRLWMETWPSGEVPAKMVLPSLVEGVLFRN